MPTDTEDVKQDVQTVTEQSTDTSTVEQTPTDQPAKAPDATGSDQTVTEGEQQPTETGIEQTEPIAEHSHRKPGAERRISELTAEKRELQKKLQAAIGQPPQAAPVAQAKPEETEEYWAAKYNAAVSEDERSQAAKQYKRIERESLKREILGEFQQQQQRQQTATLLSEKLTRLHERVPFLKDDPQSGVQLDLTSPLVQRAAQLATESGVPLAAPQGIRWDAFLYFAAEAALDLQGQTTVKTAAALEQQKLQTIKAAGKSGLERPNAAPPPAKPTGPMADAEREVARLEVLAKQKFDSSVNRQLIYARQTLTDLRRKR